MEQVDATYKDLINAIILRTVQDIRLESLYTCNYKVAGQKIRAEAIHFINSEDFEYMCECVGKDCNALRQSLAINLH